MFRSCHVFYNNPKVYLLDCLLIEVWPSYALYYQGTSHIHSVAREIPMQHFSFSLDYLKFSEAEIACRCYRNKFSIERLAFLFSYSGIPWLWYISFQNKTKYTIGSAALSLFEKIWSCICWTLGLLQLLGVLIYSTTFLFTIYYSWNQNNITFLILFCFACLKSHSRLISRLVLVRGGNRFSFH